MNKHKIQTIFKWAAYAAYIPLLLAFIGSHGAYVVGNISYTQALVQEIIFGVLISIDTIYIEWGC